MQNLIEYWKQVPNQIYYVILTEPQIHELTGMDGILVIRFFSRILALSWAITQFKYDKYPFLIDGQPNMHLETCTQLHAIEKVFCFGNLLFTLKKMSSFWAHWMTFFNITELKSSSQSSTSRKWDGVDGIRVRTATISLILPSQLHLPSAAIWQLISFGKGYRRLNFNYIVCK